MVCYQAPSCKQALNEATKLWPKRRKTSDGICASSDHTKKNPNSDHEPKIEYEGKWYATAFDLSDDPENGCDADQFAEDLRLREDFRVKYVICNRRMFSSYSVKGYNAWEWRPYSGSNPHMTHTHVSVLPTQKAMFSLDPWFIVRSEQMPLPTDITARIPTPTGKGHWLLQYDGGVITTGDAPFYGSYPGLPASSKLDDDGHRGFYVIEPFKGGYQLLSTDGGVYHFPPK